MPSSTTLTPDPPATLGQRTPPEPPASSGLRLITVPAGWPPYDCETYGAACPVAREAASTNPHVSRQAPERTGPPGPTAPPAGTARLPPRVRRAPVLLSPRLGLTPGVLLWPRLGLMPRVRLRQRLGCTRARAGHRIA